MEKGSSSDDEREQALRDLLELSKSKVNHGPIAKAGGITCLVLLLGPGTAQQLQSYAAGVLAWIASNPDFRKPIADAGAINKLGALILRGGSNASPSLQTNCTAALRNLAGADANRRWMASAGIIPILVAMLGPGVEPTAQKNSAMALYVLSANASAKSVIMASGARESLIKLAATSPNDSVRLEAADTLKVLSPMAPKSSRR